MAKNAFYNHFITGILEKWLVNLGYVNPDVNMSFLMREKRREFTVFWINIFISGLLIHAALFFVYYFFHIPISLWMHVPLVFSYGLFHHYFLYWLPKPKNVEVNRIGR